MGKMLYLSVATRGTYIYPCDLMGSVSGYCLFLYVWQSLAVWCWMWCMSCSTTRTCGRATSGLRSLRCSHAMRSTVTGSLEKMLCNRFVRLKNKSLGKCAYRHQGLHFCCFQSFIVNIPATLQGSHNSDHEAVFWSVTTCCLDL